MDAERDYYSKLAQRLVSGDGPTPAAASGRAKSPLIEQISQARQQIHQSLAAPAKSGGGDGGVAVVDLTNRLQKLELENAELKQVTNDLKNMVTKLSTRVEQLEKKAVVPAAAPTAAPAKTTPAAPAKAALPKKEEKEEEDDDDDDFDMFASDDEEDAEAEKIKQERLAAYAAKKSKKPAVIAKTSVLLDVKPWDDETDLDAMLKTKRSPSKSCAKRSKSSRTTSRTATSPP